MKRAKLKRVFIDRETYYDIFMIHTVGGRNIHMIGIGIYWTDF